MHWGLVRTIIVLPSAVMGSDCPVYPVSPVETLRAVSLSNRSNGQVERQNAPCVSPWYGVYRQLDSAAAGMESEK